MVSSDYKHGRVKDPTAKLDHKAEKQVKNYAKEFFDKVVKKKKAEREQRKAKEKSKEAGHTAPAGSPPMAEKSTVEDAANDDVELSDNEIEGEDLQAVETPTGPQLSPDSKKRKADEDEQTIAGALKRMRSESETGDLAPPPPPPPPPPPADSNEDSMAEGLTPDNDVGDTSYAEGDGNLRHGDDAMEIDDGAGAPNKALNGTLAATHFDEHNSPMQTATPPTTGSPDLGEDERERKKREFGGLNPDRMRALGFDGATE